MSSQLSFLDEVSTDQNIRLVTPRHLNYDVSNYTNWQEVAAVPGLQIIEEL